VDIVWSRDNKEIYKKYEDLFGSQKMLFSLVKKPSSFFFLKHYFE